MTSYSREEAGERAGVEPGYIDRRIAIIQLQRPGSGREDLAKRIAAGDTKIEAIRALRRRISDEVFRRLLADEDGRLGATAALTAAAA